MTPILNQISKRFISKKSQNFKRFLYDKIDFKTKIIGIKGGRGSGKTTLMHQYAKNSKLKPSAILYISCDHPAMSREDLFELANNFYIHGGKLLLIDEIHKIKEFSKHIKAIYDFTDLQVVFSGSSAIHISHNQGDLSRRATIYTMPVLSFREFLALKGVVNLPSYSLDEILSNHEDIVVDIMSEIKPLEWFDKYLEYGAYPFFKESIQDYNIRLLEVINTTIEIDLASIFNIDSDKLNTLKKVLYMLCCTTPYEISKAKLSKEADISWPTLSKYLEYMDRGSLINIIKGGRGHKSINRPNKLLLNNPNLFQTLCVNPDIGSVRESFFVSQLLSVATINYHHKGDFLINDKQIIEIGGSSKDKKQIVDVENSFLAIDGIESGYENIIPLWLFGFLY